MVPIAIEAQVLRDVAPDVVVHAAAGAGYDMAGVWIDPAEWTSSLTVRVRRAFLETGVRPLDAEVIRIAGRHIEDSHLRLIDIAGEVGVAHIIVISTTPDREATVAALIALAAHADAAGVGLVLEFAPFSAIATVEAALDVATAAGPSVGILPDPIHLIRSGGTPADLAKLPAERIRFAQICDAGPAPKSATPEALLQEARFRRKELGEGILPLSDYLAGLPAGTILSDETRSLEVERLYPDPHERARALADRLRRFLRHETENRSY